MSRSAVSVTALALLAGWAGLARAADDVAPAALPTARATLTVKVVDGDGKAVADVEVGLYVPKAKGAKRAMAGDGTPATQPAGGDPPAKPAQAKPAQAKPVQTATTDGQGQAVFKGVADGTYSVRARLKKGGGTGRERVTVEGGKDATVTLTLVRPE